MTARGLHLLETRLPRTEVWRYILGAVVVLGAAALTGLAVQRLHVIQDRPLVQRLETSQTLDEIAASLLVLVVGTVALLLVSLRRSARAAAVAHQQKAVLDTILKSVPEALVVADRGGRYLANAAAVRVFGLGAESGTSTQLHAALQRLDQRDVETGKRIPAEAGVLPAALEGRASSVEQVVTTQDGPRSLRLTGAPLAFPQGGFGGVVLAADVTEQRANQVDLQNARDRLAEQNALHLQMVRAVAHDLANALSPATIQLALVGNQADPDRRTRGLAVLERSFAQMERLVRDLSDLAKVEAGAMDLRMSQVDVRSLAATTVDAFAPMAKGRDVQLTLAPGDTQTTTADPERIGQVLTNLVNNALKFTPAGGSVTVHVTRDAKALRVDVADTGAGLRSDQAAKLFRPFSQVHEPGSIPERGSGLGLYICKGIIEGHGGRMGVRSPGPKQGSTFWFTLPLTPGDATRSPPANA